MNLSTSRSPRRRPGGLAVIVSALLPALAPAAALPGTPLTLGAAIEQALAAHPGIQNSELTLAAARARRDELAQATPWTIGVELENVTGSGRYTGLDSAETTIGVSRVVERGDKRQRRVALGEANVSLSATQRITTRIQIAARVANAFYQTLAEQQRLMVGEEFRILATNIRATVQRRIGVGRSAEAELATAEIGLARADSEARRFGNLLQVRRRQLATFLGMAEHALGPLSGDLFALPPPADFDSLTARLDHNPELLRLKLQEEVQTAQRQLAEAARRTDLTLGAGVRQLADTDDTALVFSVSLPLGQSKRAAPGIADAKARERAAPLAGASRRVALLAQLHELAADLLASTDQLRVLREDIIPLAERAVSLYEAGFERGRYSLLELNAAERTLLDARRDAINAAERSQGLTIQIHSMLGEMPPQGTQP